MKFYVARPMRGYPEFNFPAFARVTKALRSQGHEVFNPAERDNEKHGTDISKGNETGDEKLAAAQHGFSLREALSADCQWICEHAEGVVLLPGWKESKGAVAESALGTALGLEIYELTSDVVGAMEP